MKSPFPVALRAVPARRNSRAVPASPRVLPVLASLAVAALLGSSCALAPVPRPGTTRVPAAAAGGQCPPAAISLLNRGLNSVRSLEASLNMSVSAEEPAFATRVQAGLIADSGSNFRLRAYLGPVCVLDAAMAGDTVSVYLPGDGTVFAGTLDEAIRSTPDSDMAYVLAVLSLREVLFPPPFDPDSCVTARLDRTTCEVEEHVTGLTDRAAAAESRRPREIYPRPGGEPIPARLRFQPGVRARTAKFEVRAGRLRELHVMSSGDVGQGAATSELSASYSDYRKTGKGVFPHRIAIEFPRLRVKLTLSFDRVEVNADVSPEAFRLGVPDGVTIYNFNELGD